MMVVDSKLVSGKWDDGGINEVMVVDEMTVSEIVDQ